MIWAAIALMALAALALPLSALVRTPRQERRRERDLAVYRSQIEELEAEQAQGRMSASDAKAARLEIERRILRLADEKAEAKARRPWPRALGIGAAMIFVAAAVPLYLTLGAPGLESRPAPRMTQAPAPEADTEAAEGPSMPVLVNQLAERMARSPDNAEGWMLLGRSALAIGRPAQAARAFEKAADFDPDDPEAAIALGEALVQVAEGRVTPAAILAFSRASRLAPEHPAPRYYAGLARRQQGNLDEALAIWRSLLDAAPQDAPWRENVAVQVARAEAERGGSARGPNREQMAAAAQMPEDERQAMIRSMVDGLAARLEADPDDMEGWLRLARARSVLGDAAGARAALEQAKSVAPAELRLQIEQQLRALDQAGGN